jgi:hypothetical protein
MGNSESASSKPSTRVEWMWNADANPFSNSPSTEWRHYSDVENMIIEKALAAGQTHAMLDDYHIDFQYNLQISNNDTNKQRPVKRMVCSRNDKRLREERFLSNPVAPDRPFGGQYGFIPPFIKEVVKHLNLTKEQLPSKDETSVPMILEKAALGIIEEGKKIGKKCEAEEMANLLRANKNAGIKEIWKCCAHLYTLESFLYKKLNEIMRLIGSEKHEQVWRSKVGTLGPFCLLLWDNPFNSRMIEPQTILYRGANLPDDLIAIFKSDCSKHRKPWHSFQAFTSCTRDRDVAEMFGNVLFIMETRIAFTVDLEEYSKYPEEKEELLFPGISFTVDRLEFDKNKNKQLIYLNLQQRHSSKPALSFYEFSRPSSLHFTRASSFILFSC